MMPAPMPQIPVITSAGVTQPMSKSQLGGSWIPMNRRNSLIQPVSPSMFCQIRTPETNGTTYGRNRSTRKMALPRRCRLLSASARANGTTITTGSQKRAKRIVTPSAAQAWPSRINRA